MNTRWSTILLIGTLASGTLFFGCTTANTTGPGSETVAVIGRVVDSLGLVVPQAAVKLLPADFNPVTDTVTAGYMSGITDRDGCYMLKAPAIGYYCIEAENSNAACKALIVNLRIENKDSVIMPDAIVRTPGTLLIDLHDTVDQTTGYVYIPGTSCFAHLRNGTATINVVPAGPIPAVCYMNTTTATVNRVVSTNLTIISGETLVVNDMSPWKFCVKFRLNTTPGGADIGRNVYDFPVLVRLTSTNFDFSRAGSNGGDIRIVKSDGAFLPFETERWDSAGGQAEVWVKVDTVYGNDSSHYFTIYAENQAAADGSNGSSVFDVAAGFAGVWHLGEEGDTALEATANAFNGMNSGTSSAAGAIGNAKSFVKGDYIMIPGLLDSPADVTLSAWVSSDTSDGNMNGNTGQDIMSIGDAAVLRLDDAYGIGTSGWFHNSIVNDTGFALVASGRYLGNTGWHFIAFTINTITHVQTLYIDGVQSAVSRDTNSINYAGLGTDTYIGIHGNGENVYNFTGMIDEVRVNNVSLSADWIRLCFMNQREQDALVEW